MALKYPFSSRLTARNYYGVALPGYKEPDTFGYGTQVVPNPASKQALGALKFSIGAAAVLGAGFVPYKGRNLYSRAYLPALRTVEEYSPFKLLRTFQLSNIFSQFETEARATRFIPGSSLADPSLQLYLSQLGLKDRAGNLLDFGLSATRNKGLVFHKGQLYQGLHTQPIEEIIAGGAIGKASIIRNLNKAPRFSAAIGHHLGIRTPLSGVFGRPTEFIDAAGKVVREPFQIVAGRNTAHVAYRQLAGYGTAMVERFNKLSTGFIEELPLGKKLAAGLEKVGLSQHLLGVKPGPGLETLAKLTGKWGLAVGAAYLGFGTLDYLSEKAFGKGPAEITADAYVGTHLAIAKASDSLNLRSYKERQEQIAPGSTSLSKLAGFPLLGAIGGGFLSYLQRITKQANIQSKFGVAAEEASAVATFLNSRFTKGGPGTQWFHSLGRWLKAEDIFGTGRFVTAPRLKTGLGLLAGLALVAPFIPGALIPGKSYKELSDIYSGREEVPIRKNRFWEMGRTPWEGEGIAYYRPHWYPLMKSAARDVSIYGRRMSPFEKFYKANFTYDLERANYYDRPYPISGAAFEDVPILGPVLAGTIGKLIKPPRLMHQDEFITEGPGGELAYKYNAPGFGAHRAYEFGEVQPGAPINPYGFKGIIGSQMARLKDVVGLPGWALSTLKEAITGEKEFFAQETQLESARRAYGAERNIWDRELGGGFGVGEVLRRLFPHRRHEVPLYNPIRNTMPTWLPGAGERSPDFQHGDPYTKVPYGDVRLPGRGFETLHPELQGIAPESYPDIWKLKILADVAPYSDQFKAIRAELTARRRSGKMSEQDIEMMHTILSQREARADRKQFFEYRYNSSEALSKYNEALSAKGKQPIGKAGSILGRYWELLAHKAITPFEYLTPISPAHKLINIRSAVEDYESNQIFGTQNAFWNQPIRDFIRPFFRTGAHALGIGSIPQEVQNVRGVEQYFDVLEYTKYTRLKNVAIQSRDPEAIREFELKRRETLTGLNPYTMDFTRIYRALPARDRDYFEAFASEEDPKEREKILSMVPEDERRLFIARWQLSQADHLRKLIKSGRLSSSETAAAQSEINSIVSQARNEGFPNNKELNSEYMATRLQGESYPDWYRRTKLIPTELAGRGLPGPDFVGYHPGIDLEDIKLKVVENLGEDMHDFNLWPSNQISLARKPFINDQLVQELDPSHNSMTPNQIRDRLRTVLTDMNVDPGSISVALYPSEKAGYNIDLDVSQDRSEDIRKAHSRGI